MIIDSNQYTKQSSYTTPSTTTGSATVYGNTAYGSATTYGGQTYQITKPRATNRFICFDSKPEGVFSYNATFIIKSLKNKYKLTHNSQPAGTHISSIQKEFGLLLNLRAADSSILSDEAFKSYKNKYVGAELHKAFAQMTKSDWKGAWAWNYGHSSVTGAIEGALENCEQNNKKSTPCKIVNVDGYWTTEFLSREAEKETLAQEKANNQEDTPTTALSSAATEGDYLQYYGQAEDEVVSGTYDKNLWAKALIMVEGDEQKRKYTYIKLRAKQLHEQNN